MSNNDDMMKVFEQYSERSKSELIEELKAEKKRSQPVKNEDFEAFREMILPMLNDEQIKQLEELRKILEE